MQLNEKQQEFLALKKNQNQNLSDYSVPAALEKLQQLKT